MKLTKQGKIFFGSLAVGVAMIVGVTVAVKSHHSSEKAVTQTSVTKETTTQTSAKRKTTTEEKVHIYVDPALYDTTQETDGDYVQMYQSASAASTVVDQVHRGEWAEYLGTDGDFVQITTSTGVTGYIPSENAEVEDVEINDTPTSLEDFHIVLDAGHGGVDSGALSSDESVYEKTLTLKTALAVGEKLEDAGVDVTYTREEDEYLELSEIVDKSIAAQPDLFISFHYDNYDIANTVSGFTTYYYYEQEQDVATIINESLESELPLDNRGVMQGNQYVTRESYYPSMLLELGYMNSDYDLSYTNTDEYREQVASAILKGLKTYIKSVN
ncbi:MAG: N-acetylmuramoyl-L-alanine amidase [Enterococcus sp.]